MLVLDAGQPQRAAGSSICGGSPSTLQSSWIAPSWRCPKPFCVSRSLLSTLQPRAGPDKASNRTTCRRIRQTPASWERIPCHQDTSSCSWDGSRTLTLTQPKKSRVNTTSGLGFPKSHGTAQFPVRLSLPVMAPVCRVVPGSAATRPGRRRCIPRHFNELEPAAWRDDECGIHIPHGL